jgi:hypothetical protein
MRLTFSRLLLAAALLCCANPCYAAPTPLSDPARFSMGVQAGLAWNAARPAENDMEPAIAVNPSWNLGTLPAVVAPVRIGLQSQQFSWEPKLSVLAYDAAAQVFVQGGVGFYSDLDNDAGPEFRHEPVVAAVLVVPMGGGGRWAIVGNGSLRTRSEQRTVSAMLSYLVGGGE